MQWGYIIKTSWNYKDDTKFTYFHNIAHIPYEPIIEDLKRLLDERDNPEWLLVFQNCYFRFVWSLLEVITYRKLEFSYLNQIFITPLLPRNNIGGFLYTGKYFSLTVKWIWFLVTQHPFHMGIAMFCWTLAVILLHYTNQRGSFTM